MEDIKSVLERRLPKSKEVYQRSHKVLAQEVVSTAEMPYPVYLSRAKGSRVLDVDGNEYIDLTMGFGPHVLGHGPDVVVDAMKEAIENGTQVGLFNPYQEPLARLVVEASPSADKVVFCNSGTESTLYAIRAARAFTGKNKIGVFDGGYHGAHDYVVVEVDGGSPRQRPLFHSFGAGIPQETLDQVIMLPYREDEAFDIIRQQKDELAIILIEPVQSSNPRLNCGDFLKGLRDVCRECDVLFLMDEVITGFRLAYGGGQELFDVVPDMSTYAKAIGGGLPIGAIAGRADIMDVFGEGSDSGSGPPRIFAGGTFSGNPLSMVAGHAQIKYLKEHPEVYRYLAEQGTRLADEVNNFCISQEMSAQMTSALSIFRMRFQREPINSVRDIDESPKESESAFYMHLLNNGVALPIHAGYISTAHTPAEIDQIIEVINKSLMQVREQGLL